LPPAARRKEATAGDATRTWKTQSPTAAAERESSTLQKKKERMLPTAASVKHGEANGGVTQISPETDGIVGEKERKDEKRVWT
jgi:hypothetical protein